MSDDISFVAAPELGFCALQISKDMLPEMPPEATHYLVRFR